MHMQVNNKLIRALRLKKSWSQEKLADSTGLNLRTIQRIESSGTASLQARLAIATALAVEPADLDIKPEVQSAESGLAGILSLLPDLNTVLIGVYVLMTALGLGLVVLDAAYANQIALNMPLSDTAGVYAGIADALLFFGGLVILAAGAALYAAWPVPAARLLILASLATGFCLEIVLMLVLNLLFPTFLEALADSGAGTLVRLTIHGAAVVLAFGGWLLFMRAGKAAL